MSQPPSEMSEIADRIWMRRLYRWNGFINDVLLIPMFTTIILETSLSEDSPFNALLAHSNVGFCAIFFTEWLLGLLLETNRAAYLRSPWKRLRIFRLARLIRVLRVVIRARRYRGQGEKLLRVGSIVGVTIFAGALALHTINPEAVDYNFGTALWWSLVTVSTVGYGDYSPTSGAGRLIASVLILFGMGVAGYLAGFMASVLADSEEEDIYDICVRIDAKLDRIAEKLGVDVSDIQNTALLEDLVARRESSAASEPDAS